MLGPQAHQVTANPLRELSGSRALGLEVQGCGIRGVGL